MRSLAPFSGSGVNPGYFIKPLHGDSLPSQIKVDVKENANEFIVEAEIPGTGKDNINVSIAGNTVTISAEISQVDTQNNEEKLLRTDPRIGSRQQSLTY